MKRLRFLLILFLILLLTACATAQSAELTVRDVWGRPSPQGAPAAAFYMTIVNDSEQQDVLLRASSDFCDAIEIHRTVVDEEGVMRMTPLEDGQLPIPAHESVLLAPGGLHIMCVGLPQTLVEGQQASLVLEFEVAGVQEVAAQIRQEAP